MPAEQIRHRLRIFRWLQWRKQGKLGGNAVQVEVGAPAAKRTGRFATYAGHQRQRKSIGQPLPSSPRRGSSR